MSGRRLASGFCEPSNDFELEPSSLLLDLLKPWEPTGSLGAAVLPATPPSLPRICLAEAGAPRFVLVS